MRCTACGTENTPESRFCGGCGAKQPPSGRVAPTAKIPDDARFPTNLPPGVYAGSAERHPSAPPVSMPPRHPSAPPAIGSAPPTPRPPSIPPTAPRIASPSVSIPLPARRPAGLIALVLVIDLALATAGAVMLAKGLAKPDPAPTGAPTATAGSAAPDAATGSAGGASAAGSGSGSSASADPAPVPTKLAAGRASPHHVAAATAAGAAVAVASVPADPYRGGSALDAEVDRRMAAQQAQLASCKQGEVHGTVDVAFQVLAGGAVVHVTPVENTTSSPRLGACLARVIAGWTFASRPGGPAEFVRRFAYP